MDKPSDFCSEVWSSNPAATHVGFLRGRCTELFQLVEITYLASQLDKALVDVISNPSAQVELGQSAEAGDAQR